MDVVSHWSHRRLDSVTSQLHTTATLTKRMWTDKHVLLGTFVTLWSHDWIFDEFFWVNVTAIRQRFPLQNTDTSAYMYSILASHWVQGPGMGPRVWGRGLGAAPLPSNQLSRTAPRSIKTAPPSINFLEKKNSVVEMSTEFLAIRKITCWRETLPKKLLHTHTHTHSQHSRGHTHRHSHKHSHKNTLIHADKTQKYWHRPLYTHTVT